MSTDFSNDRTELFGKSKIEARTVAINLIGYVYLKTSCPQWAVRIYLMWGKVLLRTLVRDTHAIRY